MNILYYSSYDLDVIKGKIKNENEYDEFIKMHECIYEFRHNCDSRITKYNECIKLVPKYFQIVEDDDMYSCLLLLERCQVIGPVNLTEENIMSFIRKGVIVVPEKI